MQKTVCPLKGSFQETAFRFLKDGFLACKRRHFGA